MDPAARALVAPMLTYALVMTFTPGPNNVSASALGLRSGYRKSLPYLLGITLGFLTIMVGSGLLTDFLTRNYGAIAPYIRWLGVAYMVWLAFSLLVGGKGKKGSTGKGAADSLVGGYLLQFVNPKGILYGVTIYTSFAPLLTGSVARVLGSAAFLSAIGFASISAWSLLGSGLSRLLKEGRPRLFFNLAMALLLLYTAVSIALH